MIMAHYMAFFTFVCLLASCSLVAVPYPWTMMEQRRALTIPFTVDKDKLVYVSPMFYEIPSFHFIHSFILVSLCECAVLIAFPLGPVLWC